MNFGPNFGGLGSGYRSLPHEAVSPFFLNQLHNYVSTNANQDSLMHRSLMQEPQVKVGIDDKPQTYEDLDEKIEPLGDMLGKSKSLKAVIELILSEIEERNEMNRDHLERIDKNMMQTKGYMFELDHLKRYSLERRRIHLEQQMMRFEAEKRMEEVGCFRDLIFLKKDLLGILKEYWSAKSREQMLSEDTMPVVEGDYANGS